MRPPVPRPGRRRGADPSDAVALVCARFREELREDAAALAIPAALVRSWSELHDYVDANEYGGLCDDRAALFLFPSDSDDEEYAEAFCEFFNDVTDALDSWLAAGFLAAEVPPAAVVVVRHPFRERPRDL